MCIILLIKYNMQEDKYYFIGQLMAVAIVQGRIGFPFFADSVFQYISGRSLKEIDVPVVELSQQKREVLEKVRIHKMLS